MTTLARSAAPPEQLLLQKSGARPDRLFQETYNELAIGNILKRWGCQTEYEKQFFVRNKKRTPDWFVQKVGINFAVEVVTIKLPKQSQKLIGRIGFFLARVREMETGVALEVDFNWHESPDHREVKVILKRIIGWLKEVPAKDDILEIYGVKVTLVEWVDSEHPTVMTNAHVFAGSTYGLNNKIRAKVNKYRNIGIPLVVAVAPSFFTNLDIEDVTNVILGEDGLYTNDEPVNPALSNTMWVPKELGIELSLSSVDIFPNPNAERQLPPEIFTTPK